jgi:hypothetical protein
MAVFIEEKLTPAGPTMTRITALHVLTDHFGRIKLFNRD